MLFRSKLMEKPQQFLSIVQIYITLISFIAATYGGTSIAEKLAEFYKSIPSVAKYANFLGIATIVSITTYLSLVMGELVPKTLGIAYPERVAVFFSPMIRFLGRIALPVSWLLQGSTKIILAVFRIKTNVEHKVTEEEIHHIIEQGGQHGLLEKQETEMMRGVIRIGERKVSSLMTHRSEIVWVDISITEEELMQHISSSIHSSFPVCDGELDKVLGIVQIKDIFVSIAGKKKTDLKSLLKTPLFIPETMPALELLETFKKTHNHTGLIINEYGTLEGIVSLHDLMESIVGDLPVEEEAAEKVVFQRKDGSWLIDGSMQMDECAIALGLGELTEKDTGIYNTVAGFVLNQLGKIPKETDSFRFRNFT